MKQSIKWFADNHIAANLFMFTIFIFGFMALPDIRKELIPNVSLERISITTSLDGASVETVESSVCQPIENQIFDIEGTMRSEEHTSELQSRPHLVCRLLLEKKK